MEGRLRQVSFVSAEHRAFVQAIEFLRQRTCLQGNFVSGRHMVQLLKEVVCLVLSLPAFLDRVQRRQLQRGRLLNQVSAHSQLQLAFGLFLSLVCLMLIHLPLGLGFDQAGHRLHLLELALHPVLVLVAEYFWRIVQVGGRLVVQEPPR